MNSVYRQRCRFPNVKPIVRKLGDFFVFQQYTVLTHMWHERWSAFLTTRTLDIAPLRETPPKKRSGMTRVLSAHGERRGAGHIVSPRAQLVEFDFSVIIAHYHAERDIVLPIPSVCPSSCVTVSRQMHISSKKITVWLGHHLSFLSLTAVTKFQGENISMGVKCTEVRKIGDVRPKSPSTSGSLIGSHR